MGVNNNFLENLS